MQERLVPIAGGRTLRVHEGGDPAGRAIVYHHGSPGSGLLYPPHVAHAEANGIRLIGFDRAGYGQSTPSPGRCVGDVAADVAALADALGIDRFATWGISGGGPHSLACAALLPDRVVAAGALASIAPYGADGLDWFAGMGESNVEDVKKATNGRDAILADALERRAEYFAAGADGLADAIASLVSDADRRALSNGVAGYLYETFVDGLAQSVEGWVDDDIAVVSPWGFSVEDIRVPVLLRHGAQDRFVPLGHGQWLARRIPGIEAQLTEHDGHITLMAGIPAVHEWLLARW